MNSVVQQQPRLQAGVIIVALQLLIRFLMPLVFPALSMAKALAFPEYAPGYAEQQLKGICLTDIVSR